MKQHYLVFSSMVMMLFFAGCGSQSSSNTNDQTATAATTAYTLNDVGQHAQKSSCWVAVDSAVYDITNYVSQHPGRDKILEACGTDATAALQGQNSMHKVHSALAKQVLSKYKIGVLQ